MVTSESRCPTGPNVTSVSVLRTFDRRANDCATRCDYDAVSYLQGAYAATEWFDEECERPGS